MKTMILALATLGAFGTLQAAVITRTVEYAQGGVTLEGYLAYDDAVEGRRPGVLVVHEWTGLGPYVKKRVEALAAMGYVAFGADVYGTGVRPASGPDAAAVAGKYKQDRALLRARVAAALDELRKDPRVDPARVAAIGYCFGGTAVLELARSGADVAGVVSFHGSLDTPAPDDAKNIKAKVLVLHGGDDPFVPPAQVAAFQAEMRKAGTDWRMVIYGGAVHSFTNPEAGADPSRGAAYHATADRRSWADLRHFFDEIFGKTVPDTM
ncbi:MAG: dienelactone hydrolase family protein [Acidobacteria bacterium]|nr:dienelactone hydrolase family protein [Acidobacteriota bacterium]